MNKIYIIELCNFEDYPIGGHLTFAKQLLKAFGGEVALIGYSTGSEPVKKWIKKEINGIQYDFFSVKKVERQSQKPVVPSRLTGFYYLSRCRKELNFLVNENVFIQTPEVLFAVRNWGIKNICFRSPGVVNMLTDSRFWYAKYFANVYESLLFTYLKKVKIILASTDTKSIEDFCKRSRDKIHVDKVYQFPTRIDTDIFKPMDSESVRSEIDFYPPGKLVVTTGRLGTKKGWKFMIDCFSLFKETYPGSIFYFLGDGEDRSKIEKYIFERDLANNVFIKGAIDARKIAVYLNACDIYIMGSFIEGWSTSLVEAIACAVPVCVTNFTSAKDLVSNNLNGFVCDRRDEIEFSKKMIKSLDISKETLLRKSIEMSRFSVSNLKKDLLDRWRIN